jgi:hypothetical protein
MWQILGRIQPEGKALFARPWIRFEDNIRMDMKEIEWTGFIWLPVGSNGGLL